METHAVWWVLNTQHNLSWQQRACPDHHSSTCSHDIWRWVSRASSPVSLWRSGRKRKALGSEVMGNAGLIKSFRRCCPCFHFLEEIVVEMVWWNSLVIPYGPGAFFWRGAINYWSNSFNRYRPIQMIYFFLLSFGSVCLLRNLSISFFTKFVDIVVHIISELSF